MEAWLFLTFLNGLGQYVSMNSHPKFMLQQVLADDAPFLMGHVLVGASQCLAPLMHQDAVDAVARLDVAAKIAENGEAIETLEMADEEIDMGFCVDVLQARRRPPRRCTCWRWMRWYTAATTRLRRCTRRFCSMIPPIYWRCAAATMFTGS
jgi:hypothetical protein